MADKGLIYMVKSMGPRTECYKCVFIYGTIVLILMFPVCCYL